MRLDATRRKLVELKDRQQEGSDIDLLIDVLLVIVDELEEVGRVAECVAEGRKPWES